MKTLIWQGAKESPFGGHRIQAAKTTEALNQIGINAELSEIDFPDLKPYQIVHGFGLNLEQAKYCKLNNRLLVISTIYAGWKYFTWRHCEPYPMIKRIKTGLSLLKSALQNKDILACTKHSKGIIDLKILYNLADLLLPNSLSEKKALIEDFAPHTSIIVTPNAVDERIFSLPQNLTTRDGVIYVGRFSPSKNQLQLINILKGTDIKLTLVGPPHPHHTSYYDKCLKTASKYTNIQIIEHIEHSKLPSLYHRHKVHILPSWAETTGLVSLEAALCGCNIITTNRGYAKDYFQDLAWYCDPGKPKTIIKSIEDALSSTFKQELINHISTNYTWRHTAKATYDAYRSLMCNSIS